MSQLEIKHLKMISSIAKTGNMTKAAEKLFISQSALSQQLKDIEGRLNVDLFSRTRKKMSLTSTGKKLLQTAEHVIEKLEDAELEIEKIVSGDKGELKVGTQCLFCYKWLPKIMTTFQDKYPNVEFEIGSSVDLYNELESGKYDLVITGAGVGVDDFVHAPLFND
ncbi:MAG: LysR family transcriptional regulator, partial [Desulfobacteraceae bacterium]|nr:LysR family transcriptional regulator [Desulfobacteraceae bacterium]